MSHFFHSPLVVRKTYGTDPNYPAILSGTTLIVPRLSKFGSFGAVLTPQRPFLWARVKTGGRPECPTVLTHDDRLICPF